MSWTEIETTTHQDHVIKHVIGATVLGWFVAGEATHLLLDIGFLWTIYLDGEMNLLPQGVAISELEGDDLSSAGRMELALEADRLMSEGLQTQELNYFSAAPAECLIQSVEMEELDSRRRIAVTGADATIIVETSIDTAEIRLRCNPQAE